MKPFQYLVQALAWCFFLAPQWAQRSAGIALGRALRFFGMRREVIRENLEIAARSIDREGPHAGAAFDREGFERGAYTHLGRLFLELFFVFGPMRRLIESRADFEGIEHYQKAREQGRGIIFLSSHVGNWEVMAAAGAVLHQIPILLVTKKIKPRWLHELLERSRRSYGVEATYEPQTLRKILSHLKEAKTVGIVLDQYAGPPIGVRVPFFGVPAGTSTALAAIVRRTGSIVLPVMNWRERERWKVKIFGPLNWDSSPEIEGSFLELARNTAQYAQVIEEQVRAHPDQWLWSHRRFKGDLSPLAPGEWEKGRRRS